jgi:hypothetical protein
LGRAAESLLELLGAGIRLLVRVFGDRENAHDRAFLVGTLVRVALRGLVMLPPVVLASL